MTGRDPAGRPADAWPVRAAWAIPVAVLLAAIASRLPALGTWWCLDDWGLLARAAGRIEPTGGFPARWLSQRAWWSLTWPLCGLDAGAQAWLRILLHALGAVTVARIARRAALGASAQLTAGLLFAATPVAFTPLYWAAGIQELLGGVLALLAVERWLAGGRAGVGAAGLLAVGAILAKESALALPPFFAASLLLRRPAGGAGAVPRWLVVVVPSVVAALEGALVLRHFATGPRDPYALGGALVALGNLGKFGWWLPTPGAVFTAQVTWGRAGAGLALLLAWGTYGALAWRRGRRLPLAAWVAALLSLAPALPLVNQARPYQAYLAAAAGALTVASLVPSRWRLNGLVTAGLVVAAVVWGQATMRGRIARAGADGLPADPVVRAARTAREAAAEIRGLLPPRAGGEPFTLVIFQADLSAGDDGRDRLADRPALETPRYTALAGPLGAGLLLGRSGRAQWTSSLLAAPADAFVLCEKGRGFQAWGSMHDALLYAAELQLLAGNFAPAKAQLARAAALDPTRGLCLPERDVLGVPRAALAARAGEFRAFLEARRENQGITREEFDRYRQFPVGR